MAEAADVTEVTETIPENPAVTAAPAAEPAAEAARQPEEAAAQPPEDADHPEESEGEENDLRDDKGRFKKNGVQARIDELTRKAGDAQRRADYYERLATANQAQNSAGDAAKPTVDQFEDYADFVEAITDWKVAQSTTTRAREAALGAAANERQVLYTDRLAEARTAIPDFDAVMEKAQDVSVAPHVAEAVLDSGRGPEIFYHMAQHPDVAERLNGLSPIRAALEIGRIEAQLTAPAGRRQSQAPAPITPITTGSTTKVNLENADMPTYIAERIKQGARFR